MITITDEWNKYLRKENDSRTNKSNIKSEEIMAYCKTKQIKYREIPNKQIKRHLSIFTDGYVFCGMSDMFNFINSFNLSSIVPDTYPLIFNDMYKRKIQKVKYMDIEMYTFPYFVKSITNDKSVNGTIVNNKYELVNLICSSYEIVTDDLELYVSTIVHFISEYRVLVGNNRVYGTGHQFGRSDIEPDDDFIKEIVELSDGNFFCVDVGFIRSAGEWAIVEVNPPFSLVDYGIKVDAYVDFAIDFWKKLIRLIPKEII